MKTLSLLAVGASLLGAATVQAAPTLVGFAQLPANTFYPGPTSGQFGVSGPGGTGPFPDQPVQGVSAILSNGRGGYYVMSDNGFGSRNNSADALLVVHDISVDFRTVTGGAGSVTVNSSNVLSDPNRLISFPIQADFTTYYNGDPARNPSMIPVDPTIRSNRYLTGADLDIESFRQLSDGSFYFGDEFGPFLIRTDSNFRVIDDVVPLPGVRSPDNPYPGGPANLPGSGGFEGMAISMDGTKLYPMLERPVAGDPANVLRINQFDIASESYVGSPFLYELSPGGTNIGDLTAIGNDQFVVIERDGGSGAGAQFKKVYLIDFNQVDANGRLIKTEIVDLLNIADPNDLNQDGSTTFRFPFVTIEDILLVAPDTLLIGNDNNYPGGGGRGPGVADNNEFLLVKLDRALPGAVPEPATWAMMIAGFGLVGGAMRRRQSATTVSV